MDRTADRISELEDQSIEFIQSEQQRETLKKKIYERASGRCGAITKYPTFVTGPPRRKRKSEWGKECSKD